MSSASGGSAPIFGAGSPFGLGLGSISSGSSFTSAFGIATMDSKPPSSPKMENKYVVKPSYVASFPLMSYAAPSNSLSKLSLKPSSSAFLPLSSLDPSSRFVPPTTFLNDSQDEFKSSTEWTCEKWQSEGRESLVNLFQKYNPDNFSDVDSLLDKYEGREDVL